MNDISSLVSHRTVVDLLSHWRHVTPDAMAYSFLGDKLNQEGGLTFAALHGEVTALAADLASRGLVGQRVLIMMPSGLDYVLGFLACLAAGAVAVPMYPPQAKRDWAKLAAVIGNCQPAAVLLTRALATRFGRDLDAVPGADRCMPIFVDERPSVSVGGGSAVSAALVSLTAPDPSAIAFLQYTSGSTGTPKGVMVSHENIIHNARQQAQGMGNDRHAVNVGWLPFYHDMGLIGVILQALTVGAHAVVMSPFSFLRNPANWLRAISSYRGAISGGPNFAFDLCTDKITDAEIDGLDLSSWRTAFNGSEPIRTATLDRFAARFARAGFRREAFFPCYGLAEATLYVTGGHLRASAPGAVLLDRAALSAGRVEDAAPAAGQDAPADTVAPVVSVHHGFRDQALRIVDPGRWTLAGDGRVGEIWLKSRSIARGYWNRPVETAETFQAYTTDTGEGPFLRTGDLGFVRDGRLYITGRIKELIIINGVNHYPQDVEDTVQGLGDLFRSHAGAAFALPGERLAVIQGLNRSKLGPAALMEQIGRIRRAVWDVHGIAPSFVGFVNPGEIAKTSSGKIQRGLIRQRLIAGDLPLLAQWSADADPARDTTPAPMPAPPALSDTARDLIAWLHDYLPRRVNGRMIDERRTIPPYVVLDFARRGLLGMVAPAAAGGLGLSTSCSLRVLEVLGARDLTLALFVGLNNALGIRPILRHATDATRARFLADLAQGRQLAAFALTEPGAGSNPAAIQAVARQMPDGSYRISGTKYWSGSAAWAGVLNVFARTHDRDGRMTGITGFAIPEDAPGLRQGPEALTMGMRGMIQNTVILDDVPATADQVLGSPGHGMAVAQDTMCHGRLTIAAVCLGATRRCYQLMLRYAGRREVSTGRLIDNPMTRRILGDTMTAILAIERLVARVAAEVDAGREPLPEILAACKCIATEQLWTSIDQCMQMAGGRGYIESNPVAQLFRDARIFRIFEGPTETLHHFIGQAAIRNPARLRDWLAVSAGDGFVARHVDGVIDRSGIGHVAGDGDAGLLHGRALAMGAYVSALVLHAAPADSDAGSAWAEDRLAAARRALDAALDDAGAAALDMAALVDFGRQTDDRIGQGHSLAAMPETACDPLLAPDLPMPDVPVSDVPVSDVPVSDVPASQTPVLEMPATGMPEPVTAGAPCPLAEVEGFIARWIAGRCGLKPGAVSPETEFAMLGLGSIDSGELSIDLSRRFDLDLDPTVFWNYPSIRELAGFVHGDVMTSRPS